MGYDAFIHISKSKYTEKTIEDLILMLGYEKRKYGFYCGYDKDYKYDAGVQVWKEKEVPDSDERIYRVRVQMWGNGHDLKRANETISALKKYCDAWFESDNGKNRYFDAERLIEGAENGCYLAVSRLYNNFGYLEYSLKKYPKDSENEKQIENFGILSPNSFNANVYLSYLCALIEEYFRSTYIALLKYSDRKEKLFNCKFSSYDLIDIADGVRTLEEVYARTLSFQNIEKITKNFKDLNSKIDISNPLKKPYNRRKKSLYKQINEIFERRHRMIHRIDMDRNYNTSQLEKDISDVKVAIERVYQYLCNQYGWEVQEIVF